MGFLTLVKTWAKGEVPKAQDFNANFAAVAAVLNGGVDTTNLKASAGILGTQLSSAADILGSQLDANANILGSQLSPTAGIATGQIADSAITTAKIADLNVTLGKLAQYAVSTDKILIASTVPNFSMVNDESTTSIANTDTTEHMLLEMVLGGTTRSGSSILVLGTVGGQIVNTAASTSATLTSHLRIGGTAGVPTDGSGVRTLILTPVYNSTPAGAVPWSQTFFYTDTGDLTARRYKFTWKRTSESTITFQKTWAYLFVVEFA